MLEMQKKGSVGITLFGIFGILWGVLNLFGIYTLLIKYFSYKLKIPQEFSFLKILPMVPAFSLLGFGALFIIAGIGVLRLRPWGRSLFIIIGYLLLLLTALQFPIYGFFLKTISILITVFLASLIFWFFSRERIRRDFALSENYLRKEKKSYFVAIIFTVLIAVLVVAVYSYNLFRLKSRQPFLFYTPQKIYYEIKDNKYFPFDYTKRQLLNYDICLPANFYLSHVFYNTRDNWIIGISSPDKTNLFMFTNKPLFELMSPLGKIFGFDSSYEFGKRFIHEKVGMIFLVLKSISMAPLGKYDEVYFGDWKGFLQKGIKKEKEIYDYAIWHKQRENSIGLTFIVKKKTLAQDEIEDIVSSVNLDFPQKTAKEHFQDGLDLFNQAKYEAAKFSFVNALYQNWDNPQYHYYLGYAFFKTENWNSAKRRLKRAISLQLDFPEAEKLLDKVEAEEKK